MSFFPSESDPSPLRVQFWMADAVKLMSVATQCDL